MENKSICKNPWCKATYTYKGDVAPGVCHKCISFDTQLSGGVSWGTKTYTEPRNDGKYHEISINMKNFSGGIEKMSQSSNSTIGGSLGQFIGDLIKRAFR